MIIIIYKLNFINLKIPIIREKIMIKYIVIKIFNSCLIAKIIDLNMNFVMSWYIKINKEMLYKYNHCQIY